MKEREIDRRPLTAEEDIQIEEEMLIQWVGEELSRVMHEQHLDKTQLAERLGKKRPDVTQLLRGDRNLTLRTVARLAYALGLRCRLRFEPLITGGGQRKPMGAVLEAKDEWRLPATTLRRQRAVANG